MIAVKVVIHPIFLEFHQKEGCENSDFNLISDFFALHQTPFSDF